MTFEEWKILHKQTISYNGKNCATPLQVVEELVDNLNVDWTNPNLKILDPCFGFGSFLVFCYTKLRQYHSDEHIKSNMLWGFEINTMQIRLMKDRMKFKNIYKQDYLNYKEMKFDLIIGNPPYNDSKDSQAKKNKSNEGQANFYKKFVEKSEKLVKQDGTIAFILPPGAHKEFYNNNLYLDKVTLVLNEVWPKAIQTRLWFANRQVKQVATVTNPILGKILEYDKQVIVGREKDAGLKVYNYIRPLNVVTKTEYNKMSKPEQNKYAVGFYLSDTEQNKKNLTFLLSQFQLYLDRYGKQWHSYNKILKYKWLEGLNRDITIEDIKQYYGLTDEELKQIK